MTARQLHEGEKISRAEGGPEDREADLLREGRLDPGVLDEGITHLLGVALADVDAAAETPEEGLQHGLSALGPRAQGGVGRRRGSRDDVEGGGQDGDATSVAEDGQKRLGDEGRVYSRVVERGHDVGIAQL